MYEWAFVNVNMRPVLRRGLARRWRSRPPSSSVGRRPITSSSRSRADRCSRRSARVSRSSTRSACSTRSRTCACRGAQALGCSPVATAFIEESDTIRPVKPDTIAKSLAIGNPADGYFALDAVRRAVAASRRSPTTRSSRHATARPHRGDLRRDRRRRHDRDVEEARGRRCDPARRARCRLHHRPRAEDARSGRRPTSGPTATIAPTLDAFHAAFDIEDHEEHQMAVTVRIPTQLRSLSGDAAEVAGRSGDGRGGAEGARSAAPRIRRALVRREGRAAPLRQRVRRRRGHPLLAGHRHPRRRRNRP